MTWTKRVLKAYKYLSAFIFLITLVMAGTALCCDYNNIQSVSMHWIGSAAFITFLMWRGIHLQRRVIKIEIELNKLSNNDGGG